MKNLFIAVIVIGLIIPSCRKKDKAAPAPQKNYLKTEVIQVFSGVVTYTLTSNYEYDAQNRISSISEVSTDVARYPNYNSTNFVYNALGKRQSYELRYLSGGTNYADRYEYSYDAAGRITEMQIKDINTSTVRTKHTYEYSDNTITKRYVSLAGTVTQTDVITMSGNNIAQIKYYNASGVYTTTIYFSNFDNKPNAFKIRNADAGDPSQSTNNYRSSTTTNISTGAETNAKYAFEYNADGYPNKRTHIESGRTADWTWEKR